jgi:lipoprotein-releasing system ATP-binding protein
MLDVVSLSKTYPTPRGPLTVLADVTFSLAPGDAAAVTGPSGSGKSSLLYILGALEPPTSGTVSVDGINPFSYGPADSAAFRNRAIGFVFQDHCLLPQLTVIENVLIPTLVPSPGAVNGDERARARQLVERVGLADRMDHRPAALSGGERQRVAIARALVRSPKLVLCDEPTGNLDHAAAENVAALLFELAAGQRATVVLVTHSAALAARCPIRFELADARLQRVS